MYGGTPLLSAPYSLSDCLPLFSPCNEYARSPFILLYLCIPMFPFVYLFRSIYFCIFALFRILFTRDSVGQLVSWSVGLAATLSQPLTRSTPLWTRSHVVPTARPTPLSPPDLFFLRFPFF